MPHYLIDVNTLSEEWSWTLAGIPEKPNYEKATKWLKCKAAAPTCFWQLFFINIAQLYFLGHDH